MLGALRCAELATAHVGQQQTFFIDTKRFVTDFCGKRHYDRGLSYRARRSNIANKPQFNHMVTWT
ncbi:hypothetical protein IFM46972_08039 [Aspergillus udagawae]|uniref:Uncharacterized protein n=1 Tax=Aspergillus udagawae TaxID=91492 RepID=A0A8H3P9Q5_9EURO|nr:hypothetical protein IFM46972_08039 [Aspergillus udagawae]